jgi:hypothetical protein
MNLTALPIDGGAQVAVQFVESSAKARQKLVERWWGNGTGVSADGGHPGQAGAGPASRGAGAGPGLAGGGMAGVSGVARGWLGLVAILADEIYATPGASGSDETKVKEIVIDRHGALWRREQAVCPGRRHLTHALFIGAPSPTQDGDVGGIPCCALCVRTQAPAQTHPAPDQDRCWHRRKRSCP